jgi:hypothetical protein
LAAYRSWTHRLLKLPLDESAKNKELNTITNIALNNGYNKEDITQLYNKIKHNVNYSNNKNNKEYKWITYTYTGEYVRKITKLFKNTNVKIAYKTLHTVGRITQGKHNINTYEQSGIYKLTCQACFQIYIGQTGRKLCTRYNDHVRRIRLNKDESAVATHILNQQHQYGPISTIMEIVETAKKGNLMNRKEEFQIYYYSKQNKLLTNKNK